MRNPFNQVFWPLLLLTLKRVVGPHPSQDSRMSTCCPFVTPVVVHWFLVLPGHGFPFSAVGLVSTLQRHTTHHLDITVLKGPPALEQYCSSGCTWYQSSGPSETQNNTPIYSPFYAPFVLDIRFYTRDN